MEAPEIRQAGLPPHQPSQGSTDPPPYRRLRGYAFDPSLSTQLDNVRLNETTFKVRWEAPCTTEDPDGALAIGPVGEYLEVVDYDPASDRFYEPLDLNDPLLLAQDGVAPSEGNPQFHQQMVYAVAMTTIQNFERALGRVALWRPLFAFEQKEAFKHHDDMVFDPNDPEQAQRDRDDSAALREKFVRRLRIYPHALRQANAFYSPDKRALLFGYFTASREAIGRDLPGGTVFTCLSHDVIAHETTHALLDGMHRPFVEPTQQDALAFHEAFADIVALFQHFTVSEVVSHQIARTRGDLASQNLLGQLAQQVGVAVGQYGALRDAIGTTDPVTGQWTPRRPDPSDLDSATEPHERGAILVAAVFDAFLSIYKSRVADLLRIASGGTGLLAPGQLHPDLVNRLASEATRSADQVLNMCIRALDYLPPVDVTFGDYLRALITADIDLVPDDDRGYRIAFLEAFRKRGIYPRNIRTLSVESLRWTCDPAGDEVFAPISKKLRDFQDRSRYFTTRQQAYLSTAMMRKDLHEFLSGPFEHRRKFEEMTGIILTRDSGLNVELANVEEGGASLKVGLNSKREPSFEVASLRPANRVGPDGNILNQLIVAITQSCKPWGPNRITFRAGCTLIVDLSTLKLRYAITKPFTAERWKEQKEFWEKSLNSSLRATYLGNPFAGEGVEPFALLHSNL